MKINLTLILIISSLYSVFATQTVTRTCEFKYFSYNMTQNFGSEQDFDNTYAEDYTYAAKINVYIKSKIDKGDLKNKPVTLHRDYLFYGLDKDYLEILESDSAYYINLYGFYHTDILQVIDYFASKDFKDLKSRKQWEKIQKDLPKNDFIDKLKSFSLFKNADLEIKFAKNQYQLSSKGKVLIKNIKPPFNFPYQIEDKSIIITKKHFYVIEDGALIKTQELPDKLNYHLFIWEQDEVNHMVYQVHPDSVLFIDAFDNVIMTYHIQSNRLFIP